MLKSFDFNSNAWKLAGKQTDHVFITIPKSFVRHVNTDHPTVKAKHIALGLTSRQQEFALLEDAKEEDSSNTHLFQYVEVLLIIPS